ncbi:hypothetical protein ES703_63885 [subsurface metagenome]
MIRVWRNRRFGWWRACPTDKPIRRKPIRRKPVRRKPLEGGPLEGGPLGRRVVSEETRKTDAHLFWFSTGRLTAEQPKLVLPPKGVLRSSELLRRVASAKSEDWKRHLVVKQFTMNSMDAADMDNDGE